MSKNYIKEVAKFLDVDLLNGFRIKDENGLLTDKYMLTSKCLRKYDQKTKNWEEVHDNTLELLLNGHYSIVEKPWTPENDEKYYYIDTDGTVLIDEFSDSSDWQWARIRLGNCFKTKYFAESHKDKWLEYLKQEPDISWRE